MTGQGHCDVTNYKCFFLHKSSLLTFGKELQIAILSVDSHANVHHQGLKVHAVADDLQIYGSTTRKVLLIS